MRVKFSKKIEKEFLKYIGAKDYESEVEINFIEKSYKYTKYISWIPGIQMIGIGNSISMNSANKNSDIDLFIVTSNNTLWLVRILITSIFLILGVRKNKKKHAGRFCLSFFSTINGLDFSKWKIENDIYLYYWIIFMKPILDYNDTYKKFINKNESWANFDIYEETIKNNKKYIKYKRSKKIPGGKVISFINNFLKKIFLAKTIRHFNSIGKPYGVIINNEMLKFHNGDIRKKLARDFMGNDYIN